jgi:VanZ family protein
MDDWSPYGVPMKFVLPIVRRTTEWSPWLLAAYLLLLFTATHLPPAQMPQQLPGTDKHWHFFAYFGLGIMLSLWTCTRSVRWPLVSLGLLAAYGALDELLQIPVGRNAEVADWIADVSGGVTGIALLFAILSTQLVRLRQERAMR